SPQLVCRRQACRRPTRLLAQLLWRRCQPAALGLAQQGMDSSRRSARLVPVVLSLLHGPPPARRGSPPDQALEGDASPCPPDPAALRAGRSHVPQTPATGAAALGLRQPNNLTSKKLQREKPMRTILLAAVVMCATLTLPSASRAGEGPWC